MRNAADIVPVMAFHLGKPIAVMIALAVATGLITRFTRGSGGRADVEVWTFSDSHSKQFDGAGLPPGEPSPLQQFTSATGFSAACRLIQNRAMNTRLAAMFLGDARGPELPDVVELELNSVGRFFAPPADRVGFLPLNDFIERHGWRGKIVENRLAPWSKDGQVFAIPNDVHPTMICYNEELFRAAGVDLAGSATWADFIANCQAFQAYWRTRGVAKRWGMELLESNAGLMSPLLLQRGVNLIDAQGGLHLTDEKVLDTLVTYCGMLAGPNGDDVGRIGMQTSDTQLYAIDFTEGYVGAMLAADWRMRYIHDYAPQLAGKLRLMPLPRWPDSSYRTSTWGGTGIGIPRNARDPERSWRLIETLYFSPAALPGPGAYILPAVKTLWNLDPRRDEADAYFSGQHVRRLITELAAEVPPRIVTSDSIVADEAMSIVLIRALSRLRAGGQAHFREDCAAMLAQAQDLLRARIEHGAQR